MRSRRPFCSGRPGLMRSISMPSLIHQNGKLGEIEEGARPGAPNAFVGANDIGQAVFGEEPLALAASSSWVDSGASHGSGLREV